MNNNIKIIGVAAVAAIVAVTAIIIHVGRGDGDQTVEQQNKSSRKGGRPYLVQKNAVASAVKDHQDESANKPGRRKIGRAVGRFSAVASDGIFRDSEGRPYPPSEQKIMAAAAAAIENDDLNAARDLADTALASGNKDLREAVVDALGWFGADAMAELTPFMADPDREVADAASSHWKDALQEMSDDGEKAGIVEMSLNSLRNKDLLEDVANELIGMDEVAALQVLVNVIEGDNKLAVEAAQDTYESITGEKWAGVDAAEQWLQDNYKPPDDDE